MKKKKRRKPKKETSQPLSMIPPLSAQAEVAFYIEEQKRYKDDMQSSGYDTIDTIDFPPRFSFEQKKQPNNRAPGWNGVFAFTFLWTQADQSVRQEILQSLLKDYGCEIIEGEEGPDYLDGHVRTTGKRVKRLTAMLNRQYSRGYLVWRERKNT